MDLDRKEHQKRKARLSESNVVELHLLVTGLLHAVFGKEHTAQDAFCDIELEVQRLGWAALLELFDTLSVELIYCERLAQMIVQDDL